MDKESYKVTLIDPDFMYRLLFEDGLYTAFLTVCAGMIDDDGQPRLDEIDTTVVYRGRIGGYSYNRTADGEIVCTLEGESPMGSLQLSRSIITSKDWLNQRSPEDTSFDQVYVGSRAITMKWGKA